MLLGLPLCWPLLTSQTDIRLLHPDVQLLAARGDAPPPQPGTQSLAPYTHTLPCQAIWDAN